MFHYGGDSKVKSQSAACHQPAPKHRPTIRVDQYFYVHSTTVIIQGNQTRTNEINSQEMNVTSHLKKRSDCTYFLKG